MRRGTPKDVAPRPDVWALWRSLTGEFRASRLIWHAFRHGAGWGVYGLDRISVLRRSAMMDGARRVLAEADGVTLEAVAGLAEVNAGRNDALWRLSVMLYISVPGALLLASLDVFPSIPRGMITPYLPVIIGVFALFTGQMLWYLATQWRARQIVAVLELIRIDRAAQGGTR